MKTFTLCIRAILITLGSIVSTSLWAQSNTETRNIKAYNNLIVHPFVDVEILEELSSSELRVEAKGIATDQVITKQNGKKLEIYLKGGKGFNYPKIREEFKGVKVKVFLGYQVLEKLKLIGEKYLQCEIPVENKKFVLKSIGDNDITFTDFQSEYLKARIMGDGKLNMSGKVSEQKFKIMGSGEVNALNLKGENAQLHTMGDGSFQVNVSEDVSVRTLGDADIKYKGNPDVRKGLVLGEVSIRKIKQ